MSRPQIYVTRPDIPKEGLDILRQTCDVTTWTEEVPVPREELLKNIKGKDGLFCILTDKVDREILDSAGSNLKVVATMSAGFDHLDVGELKQRGIKIGYTPDILTDSTAELTVALLLATSRRLIEASQEVYNGGWKAWAPVWMCGPSLSNSTVGIVGFGRIGQAIARRLKPFNVSTFLYHGRSDKKEAAEVGAVRVPFDELLSKSDFIIVACALTPETKEMFNEAAFKKMKPNAIFVNTSRGGVVNQDDLISALQNKTILAAGLDVMTPEPLPLDSPLLKLKNCVLLPHIGSASIETRIEMAILTANNILAALNGKNMPAELK